MNYSVRFIILLSFIFSLFCFIPGVSAQSFESFLPSKSKVTTYSFTAFTLEREEIVDIPFKEKTWYSNEVPAGERKVTTKGIPGKKRLIKRITYEGNSVVATRVISQEILSEPVTQVLSIGTTKKYSVVTLSDGTELQYTRALYVKATSYDHTCKGCNHYTATGKYLTKGIVAVDPRVIKLGTRMYVPGYGYGEAQDTGGAIKGNKIDLAYDDIKTGDWSMRWLTIYLLD